MVLGCIAKSSMEHTTKHKPTTTHPQPIKRQRGIRKSCLSCSFQLATIHDTQPPQPPSNHKHTTHTHQHSMEHHNKTNAQHSPPTTSMYRQGEPTHMFTPQSVTHTPTPKDTHTHTHTLHRPEHLSKVSTRAAS